MRKLGFGFALGSILLLGWSPAARAVAYTLSSSVTLSNATLGIFGTISPVTSFTGASICLAGTCTSTVAQDWLIFTVTLNAGSNPVDQIGVSVAGVTTLVGTGYFVDLGETPNGGGSSVSTTQALIGYDWPNISAGNLQALETTDRLFAAFSPVGSLPGPGIPPPIPPGTASFVISRASGADFSVTRTIVVIPEPGTLLLLGGGLLGLGLAGRRRI